MYKFFSILSIPLTVFSQQLVYNVQIDTALYENPQFQCNIIQGPYSQSNSRVAGRNMGVDGFCSQYHFIKHLKNSNQYDIFSFSGKVGSIILNITTGKYMIDNRGIYISQTIINADLNWEYIENVSLIDPQDTSNGYSMSKFILFDSTGNLILSDAVSTSEGAYYGFDGQNTFVYTVTNNGLKAWQFRTNISSATQPLAKSALSTQNPIMSLMPNGILHVSLQPDKNGKTAIRIFDMLGRQIYYQSISDLNSQTSFNIRSRDIPKSPFIAEVQNTRGSFSKKFISVR